MFQFFSFNFDSLSKKENATKFLLIGYLLVLLGFFSFIYKGSAIKFVSWTLAIALLFLAYFNLKNINELRRYASKDEITPYTRSQTIILIASLLLFIFPVKIQSLISFAGGLYIIFSQLAKIISNKNNPYYTFGLGSIIMLILGLTLVLSPLFLSKFIVSIFSIIIILIGIKLISTGNRFRSL